MVPGYKTVQDFLFTFAFSTELQIYESFPPAAANLSGCPVPGQSPGVCVVQGRIVANAQAAFHSLGARQA